MTTPTLLSKSLDEALAAVLPSDGDVTAAREATALKAAAADLYAALTDKRFTFASEPFLGIRKFSDGEPTPLPYEHLLRPLSLHGTPIEMDRGLKALRRLGLQKDVDLLLVPQAISQARRYGTLPMSVNIAYESLTHEAFRNTMGDYLAGLRHEMNANDVVFEIAVPASPSEDALMWMQEVRRMGFRIALDNFSETTNTNSYGAVQMVQPDFVKLDGDMVQKALAHMIDLGPVVRAIRGLSPRTRIIAPWVKTVHEAKWLHDEFGIDAVQGRGLTKDRRLFDSEVSTLYRNERNRTITGLDS
jgi:EAL domain-containing protein (putative c-di-GMP-specific phosphodiesterase class I)